MFSLEHIGVAADDVQAVIDCFDALLDERPYKVESVADQGVRTHFLNANGTKVELLEPTSDDSPVARFLDRQGEGIHHVAFEVADLEATMARLRNAGFPLLSDAPQPGADDKRICFVHPKATHGVLVEFCDTPAVPDWTARQVPHRDGRLAIYERGAADRPTVLCLHGAAGSVCHDLAPLMRRLEPRFHVVAPDLSGHGTSSLPPDGALTLDRLAADARAALDAVDVDSAHAFGFSMGASVGLRLALNAPDRVARLALLSPQVAWTDSLASRMRARLNLEDLRKSRPEQAERLAVRHEAPASLLEALRAFVSALPSATDGALEALSDLAIPALVTALDEDPLFSFKDAHTLSHTLPNARFAALPCSRHALSAVPLPPLTSLLYQHFETE